MTESSVSGRPVVLVSGYWLGGWAWDEVADLLRSAGQRVKAITLPGLDAISTPRAGIGFADHVNAVTAVLRAAPVPALLVAHSGAGAVATAVADEMPDHVTRVVYVDSGPIAHGTVPRPDLGQDADDLPLPPFEELAGSGASLDGLDVVTLRRFRDRAVPHPTGAIREPVILSNPARHRVPTTIVCTSISSATVQRLASAGTGRFSALSDLERFTYLDLPTGHWPMWSRPVDLAEIITRA
jgi:pimeloyl-ACP methyl ester carboxylesterase